MTDNMTEDSSKTQMPFYPKEKIEEWVLFQPLQDVIFELEITKLVKLSP
jgi:hypothetical protein